MVIEIPARLKNFNFVLIDPKKGDGKKPLELDWQHKIYRNDDIRLQQNLDKGLNYGVMTGQTSKIEENKILCVIDFDEKEFQDKIQEKYPKIFNTFTTTSGSPKNCCHLWVSTDKESFFKIKNETGDIICDILGETGKQIIGIGSTHKSGSKYSILQDKEFLFIPSNILKEMFLPYDRAPRKIKKIPSIPSEFNNSIAQECIKSVSMEEVLKSCSVDTTKNPSKCPLHDSSGGKCLSWTDEVLHCFHCQNENDGWNKFSFIKQVLNLTPKQTFEWFAGKVGRLEELKLERKQYIKDAEVSDIFSRAGQIESFCKIHPFFYDEKKIFWEWETQNKRWCKSDETNLLNLVRHSLKEDTIESKKRNEFIAGFKQIGRENRPKKIKNSWIQFKDKIIDFETLEEIQSSPEYFVLNCVPWKIGETEETPTIDKLFQEWVVKNEIQDDSYKKTLYEIVAYSICRDKFLQRMIALTGSGANGKGTFTKLLERFLSEENTCSSTIKQLSENIFETARTYGKLLCTISEVSSDDLKNTNTIKALAGEDKMSYTFKGKDGFSDDNHCSFLISTNSLPKTPDNTMGFYRKWLIIDFPHQFSIKKGILNQIPEIEFENLARKSLRILNDWSKEESPDFTNAGTFEERENKYDERSNPLIHFIDKFCDEDTDGKIKLSEFEKKYNLYLKNKNIRAVSIRFVGKKLRKEKFIVDKASFTLGKDLANNFIQESHVAIYDLQWKKQNNSMHETL